MNKACSISGPNVSQLLKKNYNGDKHETSVSLKLVITARGVLYLQVEEKVPVGGCHCSRVQPFGRCRKTNATSQ